MLVLRAGDDAVRQNDIVIGGRRVLGMPGLLGMLGLQLRTDPAVALDQAPTTDRPGLATDRTPPSQRPNKRAA